MAITFLESGTDATQGLEFFASVAGTVASSAAQSKTGPRSISISRNSYVRLSQSVISLTAGRISIWLYAGSNSGASGIWDVLALNVGQSTAFRLAQTSGNLWQLYDFTTARGASYDMSGHVGQWVNIVWAYSRTSSSVNENRVWVNGTLVINESNVTWTSAPNVNNHLGFGSGLTTGSADAEAYVDNIYIDDDTSLTFPGDIRVTAKLPDTVNTAGFDTNVGTGAVNERPLSVTNGKQHAANSDVQQNYTLQTISAGDVDITGATLLGHTGWLYGKKGAEEDYPAVRTSATSSETGNVTTHSVLLPATVESGDLLLAFFSCDGNPTVTWDNTTAGTWSDYIDTANGTANRLVIKAKLADGTEDGKTLSIGTSASEQSVHRTIAIHSWEGTLASGLNIPAAATGTSTTPDPPAASDSWGTTARKTIAVFGNDFSRAVTAYPSGYDLNQFNDVSGGGAGCGLGSAGRNANEGSQNPGTFTIDSSDQWVAATVSVRGTGSPSAPKLQLNGTDYAITLTASNALFTQIITSASYPSAAAGIGMRSTSHVADSFLYECGALIAYTPAVSPIPMPLGRRKPYSLRV